MEERFAFDQIANVYKVARPGYPEALIEDVVSYADLKQGDHILEVGCGTGQATKGFAKRGFPIVAMDPGPEMLRGVAGFSNVELLETTFEAWPANQGAFRLIVAAQSWHWVSPEMRFTKAVEALSPNGPLAVFWKRPGRTAHRVTRSVRGHLPAPNRQLGPPTGSWVPTYWSVQRMV